MDADNKENKEKIGPLQLLAKLSNEFSDWGLKSLENDMSIKLSAQDYSIILQEIEKHTNLITPRNSTKFSVDIGEITFIFYRD